ncbi:MAG: polyphosphate kinase 1, partial [Calditerrivibrio sp.]|nr:polyphosphate kinase 1 [Calditerrivibrio sp.]
MSDIFFNRELSWLSFNERVLKEATDKDVPLLEKLKYIGIFSSNLDEFFMIRVAGIKDQIKSGLNKPEISGLYPQDQLIKIKEKTKSLINDQHDIFTKIKLECENHNIFLKSDKFGDFPIDSLFYNEILPQISPITISPSNPFPFIHNLNTNIFTSIIKDGNQYNSIIIIPGNIKKYYIFKDGNFTHIFLLEDIIEHFLKTIYNDSEILESFYFRITRNADLNFQNEEVEDLYSEIKNSLSKRVTGEPVRLELSGKFSETSKMILKKSFNIEEVDIYYYDEIIDYRFLIGMNIDDDNLKYKPIKYKVPDSLKKGDFFSIIKEKDILMFRPYNDFGVIGRMIAQAAEDPDVIAIKMTLYRANRDSTIMQSLEKAALSGKHVCVVIELKARFDEEKNLEWAERLEKAGCIVSYGFVDLKIHAKALLVVRKEKGKIVRYSHLSTGNYNETTAKLYTDIDFITANDVIGNDVVKLFNFIMSYSDPLKWEKISVAPIYLRKKIISLIDNEIYFAKMGKPAQIIAKLNSLYDKEITLKLYEASKAGVKIDLIIRGITSVVPGVKGQSENISIKSIIGRFLEHPRVLFFKSGGNGRVFLSTADWMVRNLDKRVEILFEVEQNELKNQLINYLYMNIEDNQKSWILKSNGVYIKKKSTASKKNLQS